MVNTLRCAAVLVLTLHATAHAKPVCTKGSEFEPPLCSLALPPIERVVVEQNAVKSEQERDPSVDCSGFVVTDRIVRRYLLRAKQVPAGSGHAQLEWSACQANGTVFFAGGRSAHWSVGQFRVGSLVFDGEAERKLYCPECREKPFVE